MNYPISSIEINKFRGIINFRVDKFSRINVFLGKNNVGKTSVLEAIFLLTGMSNPTLPNLLNVIRESGPTSMEELCWLFHNKDTTSPIIISDQNFRSMQIEPVLGLEDGRGITPTNSASGVKIKGLKYIFTYQGERKTASFYEEEGDTTLEKSNYRERILAGYLPSNRVKANLISNVEAIILGSKKFHLVNILKLFDSNIINIEIINEKLYVQLLNMKDLIPISFVGDGLQRFMGICAAVLNPESKVVLIDEIDNGLHYTILKQLWRSLIKLSVDNDTQLFVTTHNEEALKLLSEALEENESEIDLSVFSIQMTLKAGLKAYQYPAQSLRGVIEKGIEIR